MTWFLAGAAAVTAVSQISAGKKAAKGQINALGAQSRAEGEAVVKERLNTTIRNAYSTSFAQMQLGLQKRQLARQGADISAVGLAVKGSVFAQQAGTSSVGASTQAVISDIDQKMQDAQDKTTDAFENVVDNYNRELDMMVLNTDISAPEVRVPQYNGPSGGQIVMGGIASGLSQFLGGYAMRSMSLGPGTSPGGTNPYSLGGTSPGLGLQAGGGQGLRIPSGTSLGLR